MFRLEVAAACFRSRPRRPPQPKRFSVGPSRGLPPSIRPRRSPRTCPTTPTTPADFRAPPDARPSNPHSPSPLAVAISAARGFLPRRVSDAGPSALASASVPGRRPKPLTKADRLLSEAKRKFQACRHRGRLRTGSVGHERPHTGSKDALAGTVLARVPPENSSPIGAHFAANRRPLLVWQRPSVRAASQLGGKLRG
jgi:hypothetical protein